MTRAFAERFTMRCVRSWDEIRGNLFTLEQYRASRDASLSEYYRNLIRRGECFVVYCMNGRTLFGPSRFIGYANNTRQRHARNQEKSGIVTNPAIQKLLRDRFVHNATLERVYREFCRQEGIQPADRNHKFIQTGVNVITDCDLLLDDLARIKTERKLKGAERDQLIAARVGQGEFRKRVLAVWHGCALTGCKVPCILRASHIKPWRSCTPTEKLDPYNGLILTPNLDAAFDQGLISFNDKGRLLLSRHLPPTEARKLGILRNVSITIRPEHGKYLKHHREKVFLK